MNRLVKEKEELEWVLEENRRRVEEAQRGEALEQQRREEDFGAKVLPLKTCISEGLNLVF